MKRIVLILALILVPVAHSLRAQPAIEQDPGYIEFAQLDELFDAVPEIEANIHGAILKMVAEAAELEDPELAQLLRQVRGVYVRVFALGNLDLETVRNYKETVGRRLERNDWETVIAVLNNDEDVNMYVRMVNEEIVGMVVMSINHMDDETAFLNIVGDIDPEQIGSIGQKFGVRGVSRFN